MGMVEHMNDCSYELMLFILSVKTEKNYEKGGVGKYDSKAPAGQATKQTIAALCQDHRLKQIAPIAQMASGSIVMDD
ncbi:hypothetical protein [Methanocella sp. MCL-LM]|uniref:hypothetical protein n=1 Tax=Methanocella sp. MCL-LM TaxID=3412035 RepID=UPI003C770EB8